MVHPVVLPGLAEPRLEVLPEEVQVVLLGLEVLLELEPPPLVRQAQLLELFLLLVLQLRGLEGLAWSALR